MWKLSLNFVENYKLWKVMSRIKMVAQFYRSTVAEFIEARFVVSSINYIFNGELIYESYRSYCC